LSAPFDPARVSTSDQLVIERRVHHRHANGVSNGPVEAANFTIKQVKR
jgi:hypothetical protein